MQIIQARSVFQVREELLAPVTTIGWWLNQTAESLGIENDEEEEPAVLQQAAINALPSKIDCYIVFLPGVGNFSPDEITEGERYFIDQLAARHSNCVAVKDVFPDSVLNKGLSSQDFSAHLRDWIKARITVVSIGGTFEGRAGFNDTNHVYHFHGDRDWIANLPRLIFPARWNWVVGFPLNKASQQGRYTVCNIGSQEYSESQGYFGEAIAFNHTSYLKQTLEGCAKQTVGE